MKKQQEVKNEVKTMKLILLVSLAVNVLILMSIIVFWVVLNNAGTNRYNQATLRFIINYTDEQFCTGQGHEKLMSEIDSSGGSPNEVDNLKKNFDSTVCHQ